MPETILVWEHEPCIVSQTLGKDAGRCKSARKESLLVRASNDDRLGVTRFLKIEHIYGTNPEK
jgi:hypothetical protein